MPEPTPQQARVLAAIDSLTDELGYPPTIRELSKALGMKSSSTVHVHLGNLESRGMITRHPNCPRTLRVVKP